MCDSMCPIETKIDGYKTKDPSVSVIPWQCEETIIIVEEYVDHYLNASNIDSIKQKKNGRIKKV